MPIEHDELGREMVSDIPVEVPFKLRIQESIDKRIARMVAASLSDIASRHGAETEEEANDFDIDDDDPTTGSTEYELLGDEELGDLMQRALAEQRRRSQARPQPGDSVGTGSDQASVTQPGQPGSQPGGRQSPGGVVPSPGQPGPGASAAPGARPGGGSGQA